LYHQLKVSGPKRTGFFQFRVLRKVR